MSTGGIIDRTARLELASELLATEMGRIAKQVAKEQASQSQDVSIIEEGKLDLAKLKKLNRILNVNNIDFTNDVIQKYSRKISH